jgi:hypothetical protein
MILMTVGQLRHELEGIDPDKEIFFEDQSRIGVVFETQDAVLIRPRREDEVSGTEYRVNIHERLTTSVVLVAESEEEALEEVRDSYEAGKITLTSDDYMETKFDVEEN